MWFYSKQRSRLRVYSLIPITKHAVLCSLISCQMHLQVALMFKTKTKATAKMSQPSHKKQ